MVRKYGSARPDLESSTSNPWETTDIDALVPLSTHKLHVSTSGPPRRPGSPVLLFFSGGGAPCVTYMRLQRLLSQHIRVYFHDRAGYGYSEMGPGDQDQRASDEGVRGSSAPSYLTFLDYHYATVKRTRQSTTCSTQQDVPLLTAQQAAKELQELLCVIQVGPPYILVGHSYGAICARAFLALLARQYRFQVSSPVAPAIPCQDIVAGMVLPEAGSEILYSLLHPRFPPVALDEMTAEVDYEAATHLRAASQLTDEEWAHIYVLMERTQVALQGEDARLSAWRLLREQQYFHQTLGHAPLSVVRSDLVKEFRSLFHAALQMGKGTEKDQEECRVFFQTAGLFGDEIRMGQLRLSKGPTKYRREMRHGHALPITGPEIIVEEVLWVLDRWREGRT